MKVLPEPEPLLCDTTWTTLKTGQRQRGSEWAGSAIRLNPRFTPDRFCIPSDIISSSGMGGGCVCSLRMMKQKLSSSMWVTLSPINVGSCCLLFQQGNQEPSFLGKKSPFIFSCRHLQESGLLEPGHDCPSPQLANRGQVLL